MFSILHALCSLLLLEESRSPPRRCVWVIDGVCVCVRFRQQGTSKRNCQKEKGCEGEHEGEEEETSPLAEAAANRLLQVPPYAGLHFVVLEWARRSSLGARLSWLRAWVFPSAELMFA